MHFSNALQASATALVLASGAMAATQTVMVGQGGLKYTPSNITAAVGDIIQFQFVGGNHSITQSTFAAPCTPQVGIDSGFRAGNAATPPTFSITVNDTKPFWGYCAQGQHCQAGMVFSINADESSANNFAAFQNAAATATSGAYPAAGASSASGSASAASGSASASAASSGASAASASASGSQSSASRASSAAVGASSAAASARPSGGAAQTVVTGASAFAGLLVASFGIFL